MKAKIDQRRDIPKNVNARTAVSACDRGTVPGKVETTPNASLIVIGVKVVDRIGETVGSGRRETLLLTPVEIDNILYSFGPVGPVLIRPASRSPHQRKTQLTILRALHSHSANFADDAVQIRRSGSGV